MFRRCEDCALFKAADWYDLSRTRCSSCYRMSKDWTDDDTHYCPIWGNLADDICWDVVICPRCGARLFQEEITQNNGDFPCCDRGKAGIDVRLPPNFAIRAAQFSAAQFCSANNLLSGLAAHPGTLQARSVVGLPQFNGLCSDHEQNGLILLWAVRGGHLPPRRPVIVFQARSC